MGNTSDFGSGIIGSSPIEVTIVATYDSKFCITVVIKQMEEELSGTKTSLENCGNYKRFGGRDLLLPPYYGE